MKPSNLLAPTDVLEFAAGVTFDGHAVTDPLRSSTLPLNETGAFLLGRLPCTLHELADALAQRYGLDLDCARADAMTFATEMNAALLTNVRMRGTSVLARLARSGALSVACAISGVRPAGARCPYTRTPLPANGRIRLLIAVSRGMTRPSLRCATVSVLPLAFAMVALGLVVVPVLAAVAIAFLVGPALHEAGHALALRGTPAALVTTGVGAFIAQGPADAKSTRRTALAGPLLCAGVACAAVAAGVTLSAQLLVITGLILSLQVVSLTVVSRDGRNGLA